MFGKRKAETRRAGVAGNAPIPETYLSALKLAAGVKEGVVIYELGKGRAFIGAGDSKTISTYYTTFEVKYSADAPVAFVREALIRAYTSLRASERSLVIAAYLPTRTAVLSLPWYTSRIPVKLIEECTPVKTGDLKTCSDELGFIAVAVDPVYTYVVSYRNLIEAAPREVSERLISLAQPQAV